MRNTMNAQPVSTSETLVPDDVRAILMSRAVQVRARKGQVVVGVGLSAGDVYLITEGRVAVSLVSATGRETILRTIGPGQIFGELAAIDGAARSADVIAMEDVKLAVIPGATFLDTLQAEPALALWLVRHLTTQVRYLTDRVYELSNLAVGNRLLCELLRLAIEAGVSGDSAVFRAPTQAEMAARIGTNRETVTREMTLLAGDGVIVRKGRHVEVPSLDRLAKLVRRTSPTG